MISRQKKSKQEQAKWIKLKNKKRVITDRAVICVSAVIKIIAELAQVQGQAADIGGYYAVDTAKVNAVMRPSTTLNAVLEVI